MHVLSLFSKIGIRDWGPARFVSRPIVQHPDQIRIYSNGNTSAFVHLAKGSLIDAGCAKEVYNDRKPIGVLWERIHPKIKLGTSVLYFGGLDNNALLVPSDRSVQDLTSADGAVFAQCRYSVDDKMDLRCGTKIPPDLFSMFQTCGAARVPVEVIDELSASLDVLDAFAKPAAVAGPAVSLIIYEHMIWGILFRDGKLVATGEVMLRQGANFDPPDYAAAAEMIRTTLATHKLQAEQVASVLVFDATSRLADPAWESTFRQEMTRNYSKAEVTVRLPIEAEKLERLHASAGAFRTAPQFPLPLLAYWPIPL